MHTVSGVIERIGADPILLNFFFSIINTVASCIFVVLATDVLAIGEIWNDTSLNNFSFKVGILFWAQNFATSTIRRLPTEIIATSNAHTAFQIVIMCNVGNQFFLLELIFSSSSSLFWLG